METAVKVFNTLCQDPVWRYALLMITDAKVPWKLMLRHEVNGPFIAVGMLLMNTLTNVEMPVPLEFDPSVLSFGDIPDTTTVDGCYTLDIQTSLKNLLS